MFVRQCRGHVRVREALAEAHARGQDDELATVYRAFVPVQSDHETTQPGEGSQA